MIQFADTNTVVNCEDKTYSAANCQHTISSIYCQLMPSETCAQQLLVNKCTIICKAITMTKWQRSTIDFHCQRRYWRSEGSYLKCKKHKRYIPHNFLKNVTVNGTLFKNRNNIDMRRPGTPSFPSIIINDHSEISSLSSIHDMNLQNLQYITI